jgi:hypothetical protein
MHRRSLCCFIGLCITVYRYIDILDKIDIYTLYMASIAENLNITYTSSSLVCDMYRYAKNLTIVSCQRCIRERPKLVSPVRTNLASDLASR